MYKIITKLATNQVVTQSDIETELTEICEQEHAHCSGSECPVLKANGRTAPGSDKPFAVNRGCDCFKNGAAMRHFLGAASKRIV